MGKKSGSNNSKLRAVVKKSKTCAQMFGEAESLAESIFNTKDPESKHTPLPYFTEHGIEHCKNVEKYLNDIIMEKIERRKNNFKPTPEEVMYLLSAAWLHDIGMIYGIFDDDNENLEDPKVVSIIRDNHDMRVSRYINEKWESVLWTPEEKKWLSNICVYHMRKRPIESFEPAEKDGKDGKKIRLKDLAALVRLADACHIDQSRAPGPLLRMYKSLGMPQDSVCHWERSRLISSVCFDHLNRKIILTGECPPNAKVYQEEFDLGIVVKILCDYIEEELFDVQKVLSVYPNTCFSNVEDKVNHIDALEYKQKQQFLSLWPYLLGKSTSSCETAAALIKMLLFAIDEGKEKHDFGEVWKKKLCLIMDETKRSHSVDFLILNLVHNIKKITSKIPFDSSRVKELTSYLKEFLKNMQSNCDKMAENAYSLISSDSVIMVYGYSSNIAKFLESIKSKYTNPLYVIDCYKPKEKKYLVPDENAQIIDFLCEKGFDPIKAVPMGALEQTLAKFKREKTKCKIPIGTHGVINNRGFLCKVGTGMIVQMAKKYGAEVIVFAETTKFLKNGDSGKKKAAPNELFASEEFDLHPEYKDKGVKQVTPKMDFVLKKYVNIVVTEKKTTKLEKVKKVKKTTRKGG